MNKEQIQTALKDINNVHQDLYNRYVFTPNCDKRVKTGDMIMLLNTVPDSINVIKQLLQEKLLEF
ncbi:MAG: hypothetical protein WCS56_04750 [Bacilli bacterium]